MEQQCWFDPKDTNTSVSDEGPKCVDSSFHSLTSVAEGHDTQDGSVDAVSHTSADSDQSQPTEVTERYSLMEDEHWRTRGGSIWNNTQERPTRVKASRCRATTCQLVQLVKFMEKHPQLAMAHAKPFVGSDELWMKLADHINQFGPPKNYKQCKTTWRDLRKRAFAMQRARNKKGTGRNLYGMAPKIVSLITQSGMAPKYKEKDEGASTSKDDTPPPQREPLPVPTPSSTADDANVKAENTKGEQLVIRVTDNLGSKRNVFNRFTTSDGHFENVIVKEEMQENYKQEEEEDEPEAEVEDETPEAEEEMFLQPEAILGTTDEVMEEKNSVIRDLNDTLRKFLTEYKTRNALMRERIDLERARLQFDMEVYRSRQMEKRVIAVNAANAANVMNAASVNALSVSNSGNVNTITVGSAGNVGNAANVITVNASAANAVATASVVKSKPVMTLNPISTGGSGNGIAVTVENTASVRNASVTNTTDTVKVASVARTENAGKAVADNKAKVEDAMDET